MASARPVTPDEHHELEKLILKIISARAPTSMVSVKAVIINVRSRLPSCQKTEWELAKMIFEATMLLGMIPVYDPQIEAEPSGDFGGIYGYGRPAYKSDPHARYEFRPDKARPLPVKSPNG